MQRLSTKQQPKTHIAVNDTKINIKLEEESDEE